MSLSGTPPLVFIRPHDDAVELGPALQTDDNYRVAAIVSRAICHLQFVICHGA